MNAPKLAVLDRDGTLIDVVRDEETGVVTTAFHPSQLRLLDGVVEGLLLLRGRGYLLALASNQPGPAKGHFSAAAVEKTNRALFEQLAAHGIEFAHVGVCMHHPSGGQGGDPALIGPCACRKPNPGLLLDAMRMTGASSAGTWMIGDSMADVEAGRAAGVRVALVFAKNRCELCPLRGGPSTVPDVSDARFDRVIRGILAQDAGRGSP